MILEKINQFSEGKYTVDMPAAQIATDFEEKRGDAATVVEALGITQRFVSTCMYTRRLPSKSNHTHNPV